MTDRHSGYTVFLAEDIREDDAHHIINAIRMIKGVAAVGSIVSDYAEVLAQQRRDRKWRDGILEFLDNGPGTRDDR